MIISKKVSAYREELTNSLVGLKDSLEKNEHLLKELYTDENSSYENRSVVNHENRRLTNEIAHAELLTAEKLFANEVLFSDVEPFEVVEFRTPKMMIIRPMKATLKETAKENLQKSFIPGGFVGHFDNSCQEWDYESIPEADTISIRCHKDGSWRDAHGSRYSISLRPYKHYDYNF